MIVIGADTHKGSHALAAVDGGTGKVRGGREIKADGPARFCFRIRPRPHWIG